MSYTKGVHPNVALFGSGGTAKTRPGCQRRFHEYEGKRHARQSAHP
jgi:hypothetical protein